MVLLGIQTRGRSLVVVDETTELWRPPTSCKFGTGLQAQTLRTQILGMNQGPIL